MPSVEPARFRFGSDSTKVALKGTSWRARYRTPDGKSRSKTFARKVDAERFLTSVEHSKLADVYVDPAASRITFEGYAEQWRARQVHRPSTAAQIETNFRRHIYPVFGARPLGSIRPGDIQSWVHSRAQVLAPRTVRVLYRWVSAIFRAAVADRLLGRSPCVGVKVPKLEGTQVEPLSVEQVDALIAAVPDRYRALVILGAGTGLRQGEAFGLTVDRVNFLRRHLKVDRQLLLVPGQEPTLAPPKSEASCRVVPLPQVVVDSLAEHLQRFPPGASGLIFTNDAGSPIRRPRFSEMWRPAVQTAGLPAGTGFHALRHFYASLLIRHGESVKTVQSRLGHASATETLDIYGHLWPDSEDRTREAVDLVLQPRVSPVCQAEEA